MIRRRAGCGNRICRAHDPELERNPAGCRVLHAARNGQRIHTRNVLAVKIDEAFILGALSAHAAARDDGRFLAQLRAPLDARVGYRFSRSYHAELSESIQHAGFFLVEVAQRIPVMHFRAVFKSK
jgi:hypothetical protein